MTLLDILIFVAFDQQDKICPSDLNNNCPCIKYLELFKTIFLKLKHPLKVAPPILVTLLGIVMDWRDEQP